MFNVVCPKCRIESSHSWDELDKPFVCQKCGCKCEYDYEEVESEVEGFVEVVRLIPVRESI